MNMYAARSQKEAKTVCVGVESAALSGFAALRCDARTLARVAEIVLRLALRRKK